MNNQAIQAIVTVWNGSENHELTIALPLTTHAREAIKTVRRNARDFATKHQGEVVSIDIFDCTPFEGEPLYARFYNTSL